MGLEISGTAGASETLIDVQYPAIAGVESLQRAGCAALEDCYRVPQRHRLRVCRIDRFQARLKPIDLLVREYVELYSRLQASLVAPISGPHLEGIGWW